jgi:hypothetical protein
MAKADATLTTAPRWASVRQIDGPKAKMTRTVIILAAGAAMLGSAATSAASAQTAPAAAPTAPTELSAQSAPRPPRARTRIRVTPAYPYRTFSTTYPVPYKYEYPGPGFVRQCTSWLAPENRVSGPVIVPKMRCWWEPG